VEKILSTSEVGPILALIAPSIVRVGDGVGLYGEQWNLSGDRRVSIVLRD
jgi:hypothetical protein